MPVAFHGSKTGEWNRIRLTSVDGVIQNEVNGHLASSLYRASPRKGYISFESEGAAVEFRNMRLQELTPDPELAPKHIATLLPDPGFLFLGSKHKMALNLLEYGLVNGSAFIVITGHPGTGKTTLLNRLLDQSRHRWTKPRNMSDAEINNTFVLTTISS